MRGKEQNLPSQCTSTIFLVVLSTFVSSGNYTIQQLKKKKLIIAEKEVMNNDIIEDK